MFNPNQHPAVVHAIFCELRGMIAQQRYDEKRRRVGEWLAGKLAQSLTRLGTHITCWGERIEGFAKRQSSQPV